METQKKKQLFLGAVLSYVALFVQCLSNLIYTPIILKSLGQNEYGIYSLCLSFVSYLTIFNSGVNAAYIRFYVQKVTTDPDKVSDLNGIFVKIFSFLSIVGLLAGLILSFKAEAIFGTKLSSSDYTLLKTLFFILSFTTAVTIIDCIFSSLVIAHERFVIAKAVNLFKSIIIPIIGIPMLLNGYGSIALFLITFCIVLATTVFNALYCFIGLQVRINFKYFNKTLFKAIVVFAGAIVIQGIMDLLNWQIDKFILARVQGAVEVSIYSVGSFFNIFYISVSTCLSSVFIAEVNRLVALKKDKELSDLFIRTSRIFTYILVLVMSGYCIFGKAFIIVWAGAEYENSFYVGLLTMLPVTFSIALGLGLDILRAKNVHIRQIMYTIIVCIFNFLISIPLAIKYGAIGSAFGTFLSLIVICVIMLPPYYQKYAHLDMKACYYQLLLLIPGFIIPFSFGFILNHLGIVENNYVSIIMYATVYTVIYLISVYFISMNAYEKGLVNRIFRKILEITRINYFFP